MSDYFLKTSYSETKYRVYTETGLYFTGRLDSRGRTERYFTNKEEKFTLFVDVDMDVEEETLDIKLDEI